MLRTSIPLDLHRRFSGGLKLGHELRPRSTRPGWPPAGDGFGSRPGATERDPKGKVAVGPEGELAEDVGGLADDGEGVSSIGDNR